MKKTPLYTAISACILGVSSSSVYAVDMDVTELHFAGADTNPMDGIPDNYPVDCSGGPTGGPPAGNSCYGVTGIFTDTANNFGLIESVDDFFSNPWAASAIASFNGFDGAFSEDTDTATDSGNITNGTIPTAFGSITQNITANPDGNPATTDFTYSGTSNQGPFSYTFTLTETQVAWGTLFNWNGNDGISVLTIFDCGASGIVCEPGITFMGNGPFKGSAALFKGTGSNFAPDTLDDAASTTVGTPVNIDVLANDSDRDGDMPITSTLTITSPPASGTATATVSAANDGTIDFDPVGLADTDVDTFEYTVTDTAGNVSRSTTVTVTVTAAANNPPVASGFVTSTDEDVPLDIAVADTATDADMDPLTFATFQNPSDNGGTVTVNGSMDTLTYTSAANYNGPDSISYSVTDSKATSAVASINITVNPINDDPVCSAAASLATPADTPLNIVGDDLVAGCTDIDGDTVTYKLSSVTQPANGMTSGNGAGNLTYTPSPGYTGADSFTVTAEDGNGGEAIVTVNITVGATFSNFTMLDSAGNVFGGTNDILFSWDGTFNSGATDTTYGKMTIETAGPQPFQSFFWTADHIRVYQSGTYSFDTTCTSAQYDAGTTDCGGTPAQHLEMDVPQGHIGIHMLFAWGKPDTTPCGVKSCDIDVVNVWAPDAVWDRHGGVNPSSFNKLWLGAAGAPPAEDTTWDWVNIDANGNNINGVPMIDGPFQGLSPTFNINPQNTGDAAPPIQITASDTKLDDGVFSLDIFGLLASVFSLLGLRAASRKK